LCFAEKTILSSTIATILYYRHLLVLSTGFSFFVKICNDFLYNVIWVMIMTFSEQLRELIEERDLTQKELANELQIPVSTFGGYVQGTSEPDFETLKLLARYFGVSTDWLLDMEIGDAATDEEKDLLFLFRALTPQQRAVYLEQGRAFRKVSAKNRGRKTGRNHAHNENE